MPWHARWRPTAIGTAYPTCSSKPWPPAFPAVATKVSAIPELVEDGVTGVLVQPDDPVGMAAAITDILLHPEKYEGPLKLARARVEKDFDNRSCVRRLHSLFKTHCRLWRCGREPLREGQDSLRVLRGYLKIAFFCPNKPLSHAHPSGDLTIALGLQNALNDMGHECREIVQFRTRWFWKSSTGWIEAFSSFLEAYRRTRQFQPDLWLTYHSYYKSPDMIGPSVMLPGEDPLCHFSAHVQHQAPQNVSDPHWLHPEPPGVQSGIPRFHQQSQ